MEISDLFIITNLVVFDTFFNLFPSFFSFALALAVLYNDGIQFAVNRLLLLLDETLDGCICDVD